MRREIRQAQAYKNLARIMGDAEEDKRDENEEQ